MATNNTIGLNVELPIYNSDGSSFHGLVLHKSTYESVVMSLGDKITGDVYYNGNTLDVTMQEYIELDGVKFVLVTPPTIVREGMVSDNSQLNGMTKYSFVFYHPMYMLGNFPFTDVAVTSSEAKYLSESKKFTWIGYPDDFIAKVNKNLDGTEWIVEKSSRFPAYLDDQLSDVLPFDGNTIADACKTFYDTWGAPYIVAKVESTEAAYVNGKRFKVIFGLPSNEIYEDATHQQSGTPYIFRFGKGVGLKNNSRTPRGNKIVTRIAGSGSENNIPYGYPQIPWYGDSRWDYTEYEGSTINYDSDGHVTNTPKTTAYPLYMGIVGGAYVKLIKHPFTRTNLMPSIYGQTLFNKVSPYISDGTANPDYDPNTTLIDYYDAIATQEYPYPNPIVANAPSYESHQFEDIKPELGQNIAIIDAYPVNKDMTPAQEWDDSMDDDGNYVQSYFKMQLPVLSFDLYACAAITQDMQINMRSGACLGCTFTVQVDWDNYKRNFYDEDGNFAPTGSQRDYTKYPDSSQEKITVVLQKETATFGTLMPNTYQYPVANDAFVVLGISLPLSYIGDAETRLDEEMKSYMLENNVHYFDYPLKFDEAFLRNNPYILSQIKPNSIVRFQYGNDTMQLFVKQMSVKYGEGVLPKYDITLTDNVEVVLNRIGQVAEDVEKLSSLIAILRQNYNRSVWSELAKKLSKTQDDTAAGIITFLKGFWVKAIGLFGFNEEGDATMNNAYVSGRLHTNDIQSDDYTGDGMFDTGGMWQYLNGKAKLVVDSIVCRGKFIVNEIEDRIWTYAGGNLIFSAAGSTIFYVEYLDASGQELGYTIINSPWLAKFSPLLSGVIAWSKRRQVQRQLTPEERANVAKFRCYQLSDDGTMQTRNWWHLDDIALCQTLNRVKDKVTSSGSYSGSLSNTVYARRVVGIGSKKIGIINDNKIYDYVDLSATDYDTSLGNDWPAAGDVIVQRGNFTDTERQGFSTVEVTGTQRGLKVYDDVSGYSMVGKKKAFLGYDADRKVAQLDVFGDAYIGTMGTIDPREGSTYVKFNSKTGELIIKAKIDASSTISNKDIDTYVNGLITDITDEIEQQVDKKAETWYQSTNPAQQQGWVASEHVGDMWYCTADIAGTNFKQDTTWRYSSSYQWQKQFIPKTVFDTMDGKASIFVSKPNTIRDDGYCYKKNDMWILEAAYTLSNVAYKAGTIVVATTDSTTWNANHWVKKDMYTDDSAFLGWKADGYASDITGLTNSIGDTDGRARSAQSAASAAQTAANNAQSTANTASTNANTANTRLTNWADNGLISPTEKTGLKGQKADIEAEYTQIIADANRYSVGTTAYTSAYNSAITAFNKYTASTPENITVESDYNNISAYYTARQVILNAIAAAAKQYAYDCAQTVNNAHEYLRNALSGKTETLGGLLLTTFINLRQFNGGDKSDPANYTTWGGLNGVYENADSIAAWFGGFMRDIVRNPSLTNCATSLFRMDGSGYFAAGKIRWEANGSLEIDGKVTSKEGTIGGFDIGAKSLGSPSLAPGGSGYTYITPDGKIKLWKSTSVSDKTVIDAYGAVAMSASGANETISISAGNGAKIRFFVDNGSKLVIDTPNNLRRTPSEVGEVYIDNNGFLKVKLS